MKPKAYIRYFIIAVVVITSMIFFSYSSNNSKVAKDTCPDSDKCQQKQSEFIILESLSHNLLSNEE